MSKQKSNIKIKSWAQDFETLVDDIKNHKESKTITKLLKKCNNILELLTSSLTKIDDATNTKNKRKRVRKKKLQIDPPERPEIEHSVII
jgi:hypothetical protein